jgi:S1-C subfamily serine protease
VKIWKCAVLGAASMLAAVAVAQDDEAAFDPVVSATVRVDAVSTGRHGTGWVIEGVDVQNRAGAAVIATSYNIIEGSSEIRVSEPGASDPYLATVLGTDSDRNIAFLEVKDVKAHALTLTRTTPKVGRGVWATGYSKTADQAEGPNRLAVNASLKGGHLSRTLRGPVSKETRAPVDQIEHDATLLPGFEGGPLVDHCARVVGMNMKSGAEVARRKDLVIVASAGVMNALNADEVIKAANDKGVKVDVKDGDCGAAASPPNPGVNPVLPGNTQDGNAASGRTFGSGGLASMSPNAILLGLAALLGLLAIAFGAYTMLRRRPAAAGGWEGPPAPAPEPAETPAPSRSTGLAGPPAGETGVPEATLRLTGRGPDGEPIDLSFRSTALQKGGAMLGVGSNADVKIPDNRTQHRVSRLHARIAFDGRHFTLEDNKSLNKTFVGDKALEAHAPTVLVNGDRVRLADVDLAVSIT